MERTNNKDMIKLIAKKESILSEQKGLQERLAILEYELNETIGSIRIALKSGSFMHCAKLEKGYVIVACGYDKGGYLIDVGEFKKKLDNNEDSENICPECKKIISNNEVWKE